MHLENAVLATCWRFSQFNKFDTDATPELKTSSCSGDQKTIKHS